jgi:hypothetical protein
MELPTQQSFSDESSDEGDAEMVTSIGEVSLPSSNVFTRIFLFGPYTNYYFFVFSSSAKVYLVVYVMQQYHKQQIMAKEKMKNLHPHLQAVCCCFSNKQTHDNFS